MHDSHKIIKQIGRNIAAIRKKRGYKQTDLAQMCEFEKSNMARIENGNTNPTIKTLIKIAKALEVELGEIIKN